MTREGEQRDEDICRRLCEREEEARNEVVERFQTTLIAIASGILHSRPLAEDAVQEAFCRLWVNPWAYDSRRGPLIAFLTSIAKSRSLDVVRAEQAVKDRSDRLAFASSTEPNETPDAETAVTIDDALRLLTRPQREVLVLAYFGGYSHSEIAACLDLPLGTVKNRIRAGLANLRKICYEEAGSGEQTSTWARPAPTSRR